MAVVFTPDPYSGLFAISGAGDSGVLSCPSLAYNGDTFSLGLWFQRNAPESSPVHHILTVPLEGSPPLRLYIESGNIYIAVDAVSILVSAAPSAGEWFHLALTRDITGRVRPYFNGVPTTPNANFGTIPLADPLNMVLGKIGETPNPNDARFDLFITHNVLPASTILWYYQDRLSSGINSLPPG